MTTKTTTPHIHIVLKLPKPVAAYIVAVTNIHDFMLANVKEFPSPPVPLTNLATHIAALVSKQGLAITRAKGAVADRDAALKVVTVDVNELRAYVETVANNDPSNAVSIAHDAGMNVHASAARKKPPLAIKPTGIAGSVHVIALATKGAKANNWQYSTDGGKTWLDLPPTTKAQTQVQNLTPGTTVMFRQRVLLKTGLTDWGQDVTALIT